MDEKVRQTYLQRSLLASHRTACRKLVKGSLPRKVFQTGLLTPLLAIAPNRHSEATSAEPPASWPKPRKGHLGPSGRKRAPNMPSEATSAEPPASWPKPGRKALGAISAKTYSKQASRGHFWRASGRNLEKEGLWPSERNGASNIPLRGNFLASRSTSLFMALRRKSCSSWLCLFCSKTLSNRCLQTLIQKTNVLIHLALSHWILPHFIPCFICTRSRKQQKTCFLLREHSRLFELALLTKPSKNVSEKAV